MGLVWRRTLTSVFFFLCLHNVGILCQNVPLSARPLPVLKEPVDEVATNRGPVLQQKSLLQPSGSLVSSNGIQPQLANLQTDVSRAQYNVGCQRSPENVGQIRPTTYSSNIGQYPSRTGVQPGNNCQQFPGPACNAVTNPTTPQEFPNIVQNSLQTNPTFNPSLVTRPCITQGFSSVPLTSQTATGQNPIFNPAITPNVPLVPLVPCPQSSLPQNIFPAGIQNQFSQSPLAVNPYSQSFLANTPCLTTDLTSVKVLPTPNLSSRGISTTHLDYPQSIKPEYVPNTPYLPNYQVSTLPPVYASNKPLYDCFMNPVPVTEDCTPVPINLSINVPTPTIPEPKITIITAYPQIPVPASTNTENSDLFSLYPSYPLPPIIIEGRRSRSRSWLPLILIALIANDDFGGNCCCCCPEPPTPIPYPIAIPTNNPIILNNRSRKKSSKPKSSGKTNKVNS